MKNIAQCIFLLLMIIREKNSEGRAHLNIGIVTKVHLNIILYIVFKRHIVTVEGKAEKHEIHFSI